MPRAPSRQEIQNRIRFFFEELRSDLEDASVQIHTPDFLREEIEAADRVGQVIAFFMVGPLVMVSLQLVVVLNQLMTEILGSQPLGAGQDDIFAWVVTALTGGAYIVAAWTWFVFVRSGGFGWFTWRDLDA